MTGADVADKIPRRSRRDASRRAGANEEIDALNDQTRVAVSRLRNNHALASPGCSSLFVFLFFFFSLSDIDKHICPRLTCRESDPRSHGIPTESGSERRSIRSRARKRVLDRVRTVTREKKGKKKKKTNLYLGIRGASSNDSRYFSRS